MTTPGLIGSPLLSLFNLRDMLLTIITAAADTLLFSFNEGPHNCPVPISVAAESATLYTMVSYYVRVKTNAIPHPRLKPPKGGKPKS